jgi:streptogrisin C
MRSLSLLFAAAVAAAVLAPGASAQPAESRLNQEQVAQHIAATLHVPNAGYWFDARLGKLVVAVTDQEAAGRVRAAGAEPRQVARGQAELDRLMAALENLGVRAEPGVFSWGIDPEVNGVVLRVSHGADLRFLAKVRDLDPHARVVRQAAGPSQQAGDARPGSPWWPGGESNCSIGFGATDSAGGKHFVTAGHCTNDADQPAYDQSGQQNRIGTSNVGGSRSVNAREGDMGVVSVDQSGWNLSAAVNTWDKPPVTVTGTAEPVKGMSVCHSGNTSKWQCGTVTAVNQTIDYGNVVIEGLTTTTACSLGGDSGGAWLAADKAVGLHSGGHSSCSPGGAEDQSIFQPVGEALGKWGLTLFTGDGTPSPGRTFTNDTDYPIRDFTVAVSKLQPTATGKAATPATVKITATHTCYEDLNITLVSPSGRWHTLARPGGFQCTPFGGERTYQAPVNDNASGTWTLRVGDNGPRDEGTLDSWSLTI